MSTKTKSRTAELDKQLEDLLRRSGIPLDQFDAADHDAILDLALHAQLDDTNRDEATTHSIQELSGLLEHMTPEEVVGYAQQHWEQKANKAMPWHKQILGSVAEGYDNMHILTKISAVGLAIAVAAATHLVGNTFAEPYHPPIRDLTPGIATQGPLIEEDEYYPVDKNCAFSIDGVNNLAPNPGKHNFLIHDLIEKPIKLRHRVGEKEYTGNKIKDGKVVATKAVGTYEESVNRKASCTTQPMNGGQKHHPKKTCDRLVNHTHTPVSWYGDLVEIRHSSDGGLSSTPDYIVDGDMDGKIDNPERDAVISSDGWIARGYACMRGTLVDLDKPSKNSEALHTRYQKETTDILKQADARFKQVQKDVIQGK